MEPQEKLVLEWAHRIGAPPNKDSCTAHPRTLIMKFLNFKDRKRALKAARIKGLGCPRLRFSLVDQNSTSTSENRLIEIRNFFFSFYKCHNAFHQTILCVVF